MAHEKDDSAEDESAGSPAISPAASPTAYAPVTTALFSFLAVRPRAAAWIFMTARSSSRFALLTALTTSVQGTLGAPILGWEGWLRICGEMGSELMGAGFEGELFW